MHGFFATLRMTERAECGGLMIASCPSHLRVGFHSRQPLLQADERFHFSMRRLIFFRSATKAAKSSSALLRSGCRSSDDGCTVTSAGILNSVGKACPRSCVTLM